MINSKDINKDKKVQKDNAKKGNNKIKRILLITLTSIVILFLLVIIAYKGIIFFSNVKYSSYEDKMDLYGFSKLYNNSSSSSYQFVTKSEALKLVIAATLNTNDISSLIDLAEEPKYNNEIWVEYAKSMKIISNSFIDVQNENNNETYINVINELANLRKIVLDKQTDESITVNIKNFDKFSNEEKDSIKNLITAGILENVNKKINGNSKITKGLLNKIIIDYVEKDNLITPNGEKINMSGENLPSNASIYPYILEGVDNKIYEISNYVYLGEEKDSDPNQIYSDRKEYFAQMQERVEDYFSTILNIDYTTINVDDFYNKVSSLFAYSISKEEVEDYVQYIKENNVKISGTSNVQFPAIYFDGTAYRVRTKVNYTIESTNSDVYLLFGDFWQQDKTRYKIGSLEQIIDVPLTRSLDSKSLHIVNSAVNDSVAGQVKDIYSTHENVED